MPIQFMCSCGRKLQAREEHAGRRVKCPACGAETTVPGPEDAVQPREAVEPKPSPVQAAESRRARDEDDIDEDRPRRRSRARDDDEDDEDRPRRRSRARDDDEDDDDRPRRRSRRDEEDEDEDEYDRPRRKPAGTSGKATAALVLGLMAFCLTIFTGIPAIILALLSFRDINRSRGRLKGKGLAVAGLLLGCLGMILPVLLVPSVFTVRETAGRIQSQNNLKMMALAMHNYQDTYQHLPSATGDAQVKPPSKLSWRVQLLPFLEQDPLWRQFRQDEPWDGPHNKTLLTAMPKVFAHPSHPEDNARGLTYYRVFVGSHAAFPPDGVSRIPHSFPDGTSNTILIVEAADPVPWTKPDELVYDPARPLPRLGGHWRSGFLVVMADGFARVVGPGVSERTLRSAIDPSDGMPLGPDW
jgi:hypothetical protein